MLVADGGRFEEVIGILFSLGLGDVLLDVLVKTHRLVQVDGLEVVEIDVVVDFGQFLHLVLAEHAEGLLLGDEGIGQEAAWVGVYILASRVFSPGL